MAKGKKGTKNDDKNKRVENLKRYTVIILMFGSFLILIAIIFLILEIRQNNNFQSLFTLFETFKRFKRGVESSPLSLLTNYRYFDNNNINGSNIYEIYSELITNYNPIFKEFKLNEIVLKEISGKYGKIMAAFDNYKKSMFKLGSKVSNEISSLPGFTYSLVEDGGGLKFIKTQTNLIDLIRQYNNIIVSLLENHALEKEIFSLLTFEDLENNSGNNSKHIKLQKEGKIESVNTKDMLLLTLMYPFLHDGLKETSYLIEKLFDSSLKNIQNYLIIFYVLLLVLHGFLIIICIIFLLSYIKMMKNNIFSSNQLFSDKKFLEMQNKRIEQIKIMNNLYSENPLKIAEKIEIIDDLYKKKTREENSSSSKNNNIKLLAGDGNNNNIVEEKLKEKSVNSEDKSTSKNSQLILKKNLTAGEDMLLKNDGLKGLNQVKSSYSLQEPNNKLSIKNSSNNNLEQITNNSNYDGIVSKNVKLSNRQFKKVINKEIYIISSTFGFFYVFNIIFFIFVFKSKNKMNVLINYCDINNSIDGSIFDNVNSLIYLYVTNSSSYFYSQLVKESNNKDYIQEGINTLYDSVQKKEDIEKEYPNLFPKIGDIINLNCTENPLPDIYLSLAFPDLETYYNYYKALCYLYPVTYSGSDTNIIMEILYEVEKMYQKFRQQDDFQKIYQLYVNQPNHYKMYTLVLSINRVIRTYFNDNIFSKEVNDIFNSFSYIFIIYLVLSVVIEVIIFFILNFGIISDVRKTNNLLLDFMSSLKF